MLDEQVTKPLHQPLTEISSTFTHSCISRLYIEQIKVVQLVGETGFPLKLNKSINYSTKHRSVDQCFR